MHKVQIKTYVVQKYLRVKMESDLIFESGKWSNILKYGVKLYFSLIAISYVCVCNIFFIYPSINRHLDCLMF